MLVFKDYFYQTFGCFFTFLCHPQKNDTQFSEKILNPVYEYQHALQSPDLFLSLAPELETKQRVDQTISRAIDHQKIVAHITKN